MILNDTSILVHLREDAACLRIRGRATYVLGQPVRDFLEWLATAGPHRLVVDARDCASMDSTFIGVLAMAARPSNPRRIGVELALASAKVCDQINCLGIHKLFAFSETSVEGDRWEPLGDVIRMHIPTADPNHDTMLRAHEALGEVNPDNVVRFKDVVDLLRKETGQPDRQP